MTVIPFASSEYRELQEKAIRLGYRLNMSGLNGLPYNVARPGDAGGNLVNLAAVRDFLDMQERRRLN